MKLFFLILFFSGKTFSQTDSVTAKVIKTSEFSIIYKVDKMRFFSYCHCDSLKAKNLKRGMEFKIPKSRFDSLLKEARPIRKRDIEN